MPTVYFYTTLPAIRVPKDFQMRTAIILSQVMTDYKREDFWIDLMTDQNIFSGADPDGKQHRAYAVLQSFDNISADENRKTATVMASHVRQELDINEEHFRLFFVELDSDRCSLGSQLSTDIRAAKGIIKKEKLI